MDYAHGGCARVTERGIEARDGGAGVYAPAHLRSSLGWVYDDCERELANDDEVQMAESAE